MDVLSVCHGGQISEQAKYMLMNEGSSELQNVNTKQQEEIFRKVSDKEVIKSVGQLNNLIGGQQISLKYEVYGKSNNVVIKLVDNKTNEVIKELPPKKIIDIVDKLCEMAGIFMDKKI